MTTPTAAFLAGLAGAGRLPGGCESCGAEQEIETVSARVFLLHVLHDPACPMSARPGNRADRRRSAAAARRRNSGRRT